LYERYQSGRRASRESLSTGPWHVEAYIPSWTSYGWGNQYILTAADGRFENTGFIQQAYHGQWVQLFGSHQFNAGQDYTVELTLADTSDSYCHYQMADQMKWVYDGFPPTVPANNTPPTISGEAVEGQTLTESHGTWTNSPTSYGYQWEDCDTSGSSCTAISGATSQSYTLTTSDVGHTIVVRETANNEAGASAPAHSLATKPVVTPEQAAKQHEVTLPTVTKTTQQKNTHEKPEPPVCAPTPQPAQPAHVHVDKRLVRRIVHGAMRLLGAHSVRVTLSLMLCGASAREAGVEPGTQLTGHGILRTRHVSPNGSSPGGRMSTPSMRIVGDPTKRSRAASASVETSRRMTEPGSSPASAIASCSSASALGCEGQPSQNRSSTRTPSD